MASDRILGSRFGVKAAEVALDGQSDAIAALRGDSIEVVDLGRACEA